MMILKILGFIGIALLVLLFVLLFLPIKLMIFTDKQGRIKVKSKILWFTINANSSNNKSSDTIKKVLLGDRVSDKAAMKETTENEGVGAAVRMFLSLAENLLDRVKWLLSKCRVCRLLLHVTVAHEDAAVAAIEYGSISAAIYSLSGLIDAQMKVNKNALDVKVFCDFQKIKSSYMLDACLSIRICWAIAAIVTLMYQNKKNMQYKK